MYIHGSPATYAVPVETRFVNSEDLPSINNEAMTRALEYAMEVRCVWRTPRCRRHREEAAPPSVAIRKVESTLRPVV